MGLDWSLSSGSVRGGASAWVVARVEAPQWVHGEGDMGCGQE